MIGAALSCDVCLGTDLQPYPTASSSHRELLRCTVCGLVAARSDRDGAEDASPPPREHRADERRASVVRRLVSEGRILEAGCGAGTFLAALDPSAYEVFGLERDSQEASLANDRLRTAGSRGHVMVGELAGSHLRAESFDLIAVFGHLARCSSPRATLMEACRLLRPGGLVFIETPSLDTLMAWLRGPKWQALQDPTIDYFFTPECLKRLVTTCGFEPHASRLPLLAGWPHPGVLVHVARKAAETVRLRRSSDIAESIPSFTAPLGATP